MEHEEIMEQLQILNDKIKTQKGGLDQISEILGRLFVVLVKKEVIDVQEESEIIGGG